MKIKFKLSILVIAIMAVIVAGISALLLNRASNISIDLNLRGLRYLSAQRAEYWKGREDGYLRVLHTLANNMRNFEERPADTRRDTLDDLLMNTIASEPNMILLYSIWNPNAIDGMDSQHIGRVGSTPTGQYAMAYSRESGTLVGRATVDIDATMAFINGPNSKVERVEDPIPRRVMGRDTYLIRMMVPIINSRTNETVGGIGCLLTIDAMQPVLEDTVNSNEEISVMAIYSKNGFILAHFAPDRVGKMLIDVDHEYGEHIEEANQAVFDGRPYYNYAYAPSLGVTLEYVMVPIEIGNSGKTWTVMIGTTKDYILTEVRTITKFTVGLATFAILASAVVIFLVLGFVTKPIITVTETLKDISEGEGDLTRSIAEKGNDEISDLSRYFNRTLEKIKNLVITIKKQSIALFDIGHELAANMTQTAAAVNEIASNIQSIKVRVINQSASVTETNATMEQITAHINKLNEHVESQSASVSQSSSSIEEMIANIKSVTESLIKNGGSVRELALASEVGRTGLQNVVEDIHEIAYKSEGLLEINAVMENIASQTNLLSMNAAIEAAHAGEAGKGFAVVADEIRKLAENSSEQSKTIGSLLKKIKEAIDKITDSTGAVLARFEVIDSGIKTVSEQEGRIQSAMEEQGEGSKHILDAVEQLNMLTGYVRNESEEMLDGSKEVIQESKNLERVTQEITGGMNEMAAGADQINVAVTRVNEISAKNKENIDLLVQEVSRFKVE